MPQPAQHSPFGLRFEVLATIAKGSTARVDLCRSLGPQQQGQLIAVKRLLPELLHDEVIGKRFLDEVWMTAALRDPHVVSVVGWGQDEQGPYLACELVQGVSLGRLWKSVVETGEQFAERLVVYLGLCVAKGLAAAHEMRSERGELVNLVHRDISSQNVLIGFQGEVKIADFGLAKAKDRLTVTTTELPTRPMGHIAPEELEQKPIDLRADIFGFGVMLYELFTNKPPFRGKDEIAVLEAVLKKRPEEPSDLRPKMDRALSVLVLRCLEKDPGRRPQSAREIAHALEEWLYMHGYLRDSQESLARFVRRNSMRQMRWFEGIVSPRAGGQVVAPDATGLLQRPNDLAGGYTSASRAATSSGPSVRRDNEPTVVGGRRPIPGDGLRRSRSSDAIPSAAGRARRRDPPARTPLGDAIANLDTSDPKTYPTKTAELGNKRFAEVPSVASDEEELDEIPTVALKVDAKMRSEIRDFIAQRGAPAPPPPPPPSSSPSTPRGTLETVRMEDVETSQEHTIGELARLMGEDGPSGVPSPPRHPRDTPQVSARALAQHIDNELARLRNLAAVRHEAARVAKETARRAALEADEAEADARAVERALVGARAALELASRGDGNGAARRLEEALASLEPTKRTAE